MVRGWRRRAEAGCSGLTSSSRQSCTARAFRSSGTMQRISRDFRICAIDMEIARSGTSRRLANQPSPICCFRQASSRVTTRYGSCGLEVGGGIVEGQVAVLADTHEGHVDRMRGQELAHPKRLRRGIGRVSLDEVEGARPHPGHDPLLQVAAKARGMRLAAARRTRRGGRRRSSPNRSPAPPSARRETRTARRRWRR